MNPPPSKPSLVVIEDHKVRNAFIAVVTGIVVLLFVGYGVVHMASPVQGNKLTGTIVEKVFTPRSERQITFSGRKIKGVKEINGDYLLKVRVEEKQRTYDVPVEESVYESKQVGDSITFIRPPSEQSGG